jgi:acetyl esterase/lipase
LITVPLLRIDRHREAVTSVLSFSPRMRTNILIPAICILSAIGSAHAQASHLSLAQDSLALNPDIRTHITPQTPPTFLLQNEDDPVDRVENMLSYFAALKKAGVPVEMHSYATGGHAFGLRRTPWGNGVA